MEVFTERNFVADFIDKDSWWTAVRVIRANNISQWWRHYGCVTVVCRRNVISTGLANDQHDISILLSTHWPSTICHTTYCESSKSPTPGYHNTTICLRILLLVIIIIIIIIAIGIHRHQTRPRSRNAARFAILDTVESLLAHTTHYDQTSRHL